jgi:hypothetical protein
MLQGLHGTRVRAQTTRAQGQLRRHHRSKGMTRTSSSRREQISLRKLATLSSRPTPSGHGSLVTANRRRISPLPGASPVRSTTQTHGSSMAQSPPMLDRLLGQERHSASKARVPTSAGCPRQPDARTRMATARTLTNTLRESATEHHAQRLRVWFSANGVAQPLSCWTGSLRKVAIVQVAHRRQAIARHRQWHTPEAWCSHVPGPDGMRGLAPAVMRRHAFQMRIMLLAALRSCSGAASRKSKSVLRRSQ